MCMATSSILTVAAIGASAAGTAYAAHEQGQAAETNAAASERATAQQTALGQQALDVQKENQRKAEAALSPYRDLGSQALGNLGLQPGASSLGQMNGAKPFNQIPLGGMVKADRTNVGNVLPAERPGAPTSSPSDQPNAPQTLQALAAQQTQTSMPQVGERRMINGQVGEWTGQAWVAAGGNS